MTNPRDSQGAWVLLVGPGEHTARLPALLRGLAADLETGPPDPIRALEDLAELFCDFPRSGRIVLDADHFANDQVGLVRAFLSHHPGFALDLIGSDPGAAAVRRLLGHPRARYWSTPLDLDALDAFLRPPQGSAPETSKDPDLVPAASSSPRPRREPAVERGSRARADRDELPLGGPSMPLEVRAEVERILGRPRAAGTPDRPRRRPADSGPGPAPDFAPPEAIASDPPVHTVDPAAPLPGPAPAPEARIGPRQPAPYFRDQISDLADFAQRLELGLARVREEAQSVTEQAEPDDAVDLERGLDDLELEALRLAHFARTLGYVATPPPRGGQRIDLGGMLRELLAAPVEGGGPAIEAAFEEGLAVRADKALLALALDALVVLATRCAGPEQSVRVRGRRVVETDSVRVELAFPAGPLAGLALERLFEPYALRRQLPDLGPNALAAAAGIVHGQGGSLQVAPGSGGRLRVALVLPAAEA